MASEVASAYVSLTANIGGLTSGLAAAEAQTRRFASTADMQAKRSGAAFAAMGKVMRRGGLVAAAGIAVGLTSAVKTAANFETEMSALRSVTKAGAKDMDRLKESALDLGAATKFSALEVAGAQTELARAGMSTSQILGGSLKGSLALAAAGQMELADASATIVDTMGQFGLKVGDATHIADALAEAANATTADVAEMAGALENVGNIAKNAGLSFDQTVVGLELLAENGTKGAEAGSALRSMLTRISTATPKATQKMKELGIEFYDAEGNFKSMDRVSAMLQKSFAGLTAEQKQNAAAVIAGQYGQKALLAIMSGGPKMANEFARGLERQGSAAEMAATMNDNLEGKLEQLGGAMETIKIRVGSALIPILSDAAVKTAEWLDEIGNSKALEGFADGLADGFRSFAATAGEAWTVVQPLLSQLGGIGASAFSALASAAQGAAPVLSVILQAAGGVASAILSVVGPIASFAASLAGIPGVAQAATAGLVGIGAAMLTLRAATLSTAAVAGAQWAASWASWLGTAGKLAAEATRAGGAMGLLRFATAGMMGPAGIAAAGVGILAGGVALFASGAFSGASAAQMLAASLNPVAAAADRAAGAISNLRGATGGLKDAHLAEKGALLAVEAAQARVTTLRQQGKKGTLEYRQAVNDLATAERNADKARQGTARAQQQVNKTALSGVVSLARFATANQRSTMTLGQQVQALARLGKSFGQTGPQTQAMINAWKRLDAQGADIDSKMNVIRTSLKGAAKELRATGDAAGAAKLERLSRLDTAGLQKFAGEFQNLREQGVKAGAAINQALAKVKPKKSVDLNVKSASAVAAANRTRAAIDRIKGKNVTVNAETGQAISGLNAVQASLAAIPTSKTVTVTTRFVGEHPKGSPRVYEMLGMLDKTPKSRTVDVTFRPHGTAEMARTARAVGSGDLAGLKGKYGGGSTSPLQSAIGSAGSLLIKADLDIANLPEVIQEANTAGLSIGGAFGQSIDKQRQALARTVGQSNELIKRIEALRNLTGQLGRAQAAVKSAKGDSGEMKKARAQLAKVQADIAVAQKKFAALAGNDTAAQALGKFNKKIARQVSALNVPARDLRAKAEEFTTAKERFVEAFKTQALEQFDQDTQRRLDSIRGTFEDGFRMIGSSFELVPGIMSQIEGRLAASTKGVTDALQAETDAISETYRVRGKALDRELSAEMKAFDKQAKAREQAIDDQTKALTASEAKLAAIRGQANDANLNRGLIDAEEALREAITKRMPEGEVKARMRAVEEARQAVQIAALEKSAETERAEADARGESQKEALAAQIETERHALEDAQELRTMALQAQQDAETSAAQARAEQQTTALSNAAAAERLYWQSQQDAQTSALESQRNVERASLERSLENWGGNFMRLRAMVGGNHATVLGQVNQFGDALSVSGERLGHGYADGLRRAFPDLRRAGEQAAGILARYLQLHSPADAGPLSSLDKWWKPFGATLTGGADFDAAQRLMAQFADPTRGGASWGGVGGGPVQIDVTVNDSTTVGMSREQARRLANELKPELDRIVGIR